MKGFWTGVAVGAGLAGALVAGAGRLGATVYGMTGADAKSSYKILLENDRVRVREAVFPGGVPNTGMHTHQYAHVGVILTKGALLFTNPDGTTETVNFEPGSVGFRPANATHAVGSPGPETMRVIEVEIK
jgi:quercetin dioxygenase-like cupin family protein